jgi:hypothetical protein
MCLEFQSGSLVSQQTALDAEQLSADVPGLLLRDADSSQDWTNGRIIRVRVTTLIDENEHDRLLCRVKAVYVLIAYTAFYNAIE